MADETGGLYYSVRPPLYATVLRTILQELHFRYQLGFRPPALDGKRHQLRVEYSSEAKKVQKKVQLRYRSEYIPSIK
jgi:hypothetical protein